MGICKSVALSPGDKCENLVTNPIALYIGPKNAAPAVPAYSTRASMKFGMFCLVFISLYCLIYCYMGWPLDFLARSEAYRGSKVISISSRGRPHIVGLLFASSSEPSFAANLTWVLRQRESFLQILQPTNFTALLTPSESRCDPQRLVTIVVCSAAANDVARHAIRETWATESPEDSRVFFILGKGALNDTELQEKIEAESERYDDLIQEDFLDTYNNLTLKSAFLLKWANYSGCAASSRYILKTDDDMYINVRNLVKVLRTKGKSRMLLGALIVKAKPVRDSKSKWFVPSYVFSEKLYPDYLSGTGYVMSTDLVTDFLRTIKKTPFFYLEDIYVTGLLARLLGVRRLNHEGFKYYKRKSSTCLFRSLISAHMMTPSKLREMFSDVHDKTKSCK